MVDRPIGLDLMLSGIGTVRAPKTEETQGPVSSRAGRLRRQVLRNRGLVVEDWTFTAGNEDFGFWCAVDARDALVIVVRVACEYSQPVC